MIALTVQNKRQIMTGFGREVSACSKTNLVRKLVLGAVVFKKEAKPVSVHLIGQVSKEKNNEERAYKIILKIGKRERV